MHKQTRRQVVRQLATSMLALSQVETPAWSAEDKPIRLIVPYPPGGAADAVARLLGVSLAAQLNRSVFVENKPGASTILAAETVVHAPADGNTLFLTTESTLATNPSLYPKLPYSATDFSPISLVVDMPMVLVASAHAKANTVADVISIARSAPGKSTYASIGAGSPQHLSMELFNRMAGVTMTHIPYRGGSPALTDLAGGHVDYFFAALGTALSFGSSGRLKMIGLTGSSRSLLMPGVPTISEAGLGGYESSVWLGLLAPAGMSKQKIDELYSAVSLVVNSPQQNSTWEKLGVLPVGSTPAAFASKIEADSLKWGKLINDAGIKPD